MKNIKDWLAIEARTRQHIDYQKTKTEGIEGRLLLSFSMWCMLYQAHKRGLTATIQETRV